MTLPPNPFIERRPKGEAFWTPLMSNIKPSGEKVPPTNLAELLEAAAKQEQERLSNQIAEAQQKLITISYDKAAAYTTVIIFGGYAGFFAIWQLTKDYLTKQQALWSALLILISLTLFVFFEVLKMVLVSKAFLSKAKILGTPEVRTNPQRLLQALNDLEAVQQAILQGFIAVWAATVAICVVSAIGGAGILAYAFIRGLLK